LIISQQASVAQPSQRMRSMSTPQRTTIIMVMQEREAISPFCTQDGVHQCDVPNGSTMSSISMQRMRTENKKLYSPT
jgi:hypothetical protein